MWHNGDIDFDMLVDHKDRNRSNDRIENLRLATRSENSYNSAGRNSNTGQKHIWQNPRDGYFYVRVDSKHQGSFQTLEDAIACRDEAVQRLFREFAPCLT
jgi:hypothetical protein